MLLMTPQDIAAAITSGLAGPIVGAGMILAAWLIGKYKSGIGWKVQLMHAWEQTRPLLIPVLLVAGAALMAGVGVVPTVTLAITALLTAGGWSAKKAIPASANNKIEYIVDVDTSQAVAALEKVTAAADEAVKSFEKYSDAAEAVDTPDGPTP